MSYGTIWARYCNVNWFEYTQTVTAIKKYIKKHPKANRRKLPYPFIPLNIRIHSLPSKDAQPYYKLFNTNTENKISALNRWNDKLETNIDKQSWITIFSMVHINSDNMLKWFQYCLIHRILGIKEYLVKTKITDNSTCSLDLLNLGKM